MHSQLLDGRAERWQWKAPKAFRHYQQRATGDDLKELQRLQRALPSDENSKYKPDPISEI
jgi:hypothetical protein